MTYACSSSTAFSSGSRVIRTGCPYGTYSASAVSAPSWWARASWSNRPPMVGTSSGARRTAPCPLASSPTALATFPSRTVTRNVPIRLRSPSLDVNV